MNAPYFWTGPTLLAQEAEVPLDTSVAPAGDPEATDGEAGTTLQDGTALRDGTAGDADGARPTGGLFDSAFFLPLLLLFVVLMMFSLGGGRKEKKRRAAMIASLKKGAKVQTVGGVLGTVVEVRDDEVLVKVDESSNTRMRFAKTAINAVTSEE